MTYRGMVKDGVVVLEGGAPPEGTVVEVTPVGGGPTRSFRDLPGFGIWKDRADLPADSAEAARVLAEQLMRRTDE